MAEQKLIGTQHLDLGDLPSQVNKANDLLQSLGTNVNLDMSSIVKQQVTAQLKRQAEEVKKVSSEAKKSSGDFGELTSRMASVTSETSRWTSGSAEATSRIVRGYTEAGVAITEVYNKQKQLVSITEKRQGDHSYQDGVSNLVNAYKLELEAKTKLLALDKESSAGQYWQNQLANAQAVIQAYEQENSAALRSEQAIRAKASAAERYNQVVAESQTKRQTQKEHEPIEKATAAYRNLKIAYTQYAASVKAGNSEGQAYWNSQISAQRSILNAVEQETRSLGQESSARKEIISLIQQANNLQTQTTESVTKTASAIDTMVSRIGAFITNMLLIRGMKTQWTNASEYVSEYYDLLNEIQIVTGKTDAEAGEMGDRFLSLAKDMKISSTEIAEAAVTFYRQGLGDTEASERLEWTTKYAKIAGIELAQAAELVTATTNSMGQSAERVVDVFAYLGDASASGADEIGIAMQRASAAASEFGLSFEWLGAYIATISEKTRQAPETIGTALNSIMSRLHNIKQNGFNQDDETKINDVAKALKNIGVALLDADGNWRNMSDIFNDIASQWGNLDAKTKSYIATVLAGTRQQNYFLALMNDMSQATENGSRAFELYEGAINAAGTATEKYAVWQNSVEASQNNLANSLQELYSLQDANVIKGVYDSLAALVSMFAVGTENMKGWNIAAPFLAAGLVAIGVAASTAGGLFTAFVSSISAHPIGWALTAAAVVAGVLTGISSSFSDTTTDIDEDLASLNKGLSDIKTSQENFTKDQDRIEQLRNRYIELSSKVTQTADESAELKQIMSDIANLSPSLKSAVESASGGYEEQTKIVKALNDELRENRRQHLLEAQQQAREELSKADTDLNKYHEKEKVLASQKEIYDDYQKFLNENYEKVNGNYWKDNRQQTEDQLVRAFMEHYREKGTEVFTDYDGADLMATRIANMKKFEKQTGIVFAEDDETQSAVHELLYGYELSVAENQKDYAELQRIVYGLLDASIDIDGLIGPLAQQVQNEAQRLKENLDFSKDTISDQGIAAMNELNNYVDIARKTQEENDIASQKLLERLDAAKKQYENKPTQEALDVYNQIVDEWNEKFGKDPDHITLDHMDDSLIKNLNDTADAANETSAAQANVKTAAEEYSETTAKRMQTQEAQKSGFATQLKGAMDAYNYNPEDGSFNIKALKQYLNTMASENDQLFKAFIDQNPFMALIERGEEGYTGEAAVAKIQGMIADAEAVGKYWQEYYEKIGSIKTKPANDATAEGTATLEEQIQAALQGALDAARNGSEIGGENGGITSMLDWVGNLADDVKSALQTVVPEFAKLQENFDGATKSAISLDEMIAIIESRMSGSFESFQTKWNELLDSSGDDPQLVVDFLEKLQNMTDETLSNARASWDQQSDTQKKSLKKMLGQSNEFWEEFEEGTKISEKGMKDLNKALTKLKIKQLEDAGDIMKGTSDVLKDAGTNAKSFNDKSKSLIQTVYKIAQAQAAYNIAVDESKKGTDEYTKAMSSLASYTGYSADYLAGNMDAAQMLIQGDAAQAASTIEWLANMLAAAAGVTFDASNWSGQLAALAASSDATTAAVANLVSNMLQAAGASLYMDGNTVKVKWGSSTRLPGGGGGSSGGSKGGGGGGGGGGDKKDENTSSTSAEERYVSKAKWELDQIDNIIEQINTQMGTFQNEGYLTGEINALGQINEQLEQQNKLYESNLKGARAMLPALYAELSAQQIGTEEYDNVLARIEIIQDAVTDWTQSLLDNNAAIRANKKSIDDLYKEIRQKEIDVENLILQAIEDREQREEDQLNARIELENQILEILQEQTETEREDILKSIEDQIEALERQKDLISEMLDKRNEDAENEEKKLELMKLEAQYARIIADPTRGKEAQKIQEEIASLRKELGWDAAEQEAEAQQDAIDDQIQTLEDYQEFIEQYYDDLLDNPKAFIEKINEIMRMSQEDILAWLQTNSEEYINATESTQLSMTQSWTDTLDTMNGIIRTHWDEVQSIIAQGDDAIIAFLEANTEDYRQASKKQAEAYVDEWRTALDDVRKAHENLKADITKNDFINTTPTQTGSSSSSGNKGGGGGGGGGGNGSEKAKQWYVALNGEIISGPYANNGQASQAAFLAEQSAHPTEYRNLKNAENHWADDPTDPQNIEVRRQAQSAWQRVQSGYRAAQFARGGLARFTGPAWLDGSPSDPERILSPYQTKLFEGMIEILQSIDRIKVSPLSSIGKIPTTGGYTFGDINISVASLEDDTDFDELTERVKEAIMEAVNRGQAIGGLRLR